MAFTQFIVRRLQSGKSDAFTRMIIRFATGTITLCIAVILLAHAMILGFKEEIKAKVFGFWGHIQITAFNVNQTFESPPISANQVFYPDLDTLERITYQWENSRGRISQEQTKGGIQHIQVYALKPGILTRKDALEGILLKGVGADFRWDFMGRYIEEGQILNLSLPEPSREIWISRTTADRMQLKIEDQLIVHFIQGERQAERRFTVSGIYKTGLEEYDKKFALVDIRHLRELGGWGEDEVSGFEIFVDHLEDVDALTDHIYYEYLPADLYVEGIRQKFPAIFDWVDIQNINERVLLILMLLVALINLFTVLLILILERFNMIGILKALGASDGAIRAVFVQLALRILLGGLFWGNLLAFALGFFQQKTGFFKLSEAEYYLDVVPIQWDIWFILFVNLFIVVVTALCLWVPSLYIRYIHPVKAIRFK